MTAELPVVAAIDVGTNSVHMVVARGIGPSFEVITREKSAVRLGEGGGDMKRLGDKAMDRAVRALVNMKKVADAHHAPIFAVATSAVREADNGSDFVDRVRSEAGIDIRVISGVEEARLIHLGAVRALPLTGRRCLIIDIGGGSTEIVVADNLDELFARSFKLGAVRLTNRFFDGQGRFSAAVSSCAKHVESMLAPVKREVRSLGHDVAVVSSGTAETLARMCAANRGEQIPLSMNGFVFSRAELDGVLQSLVAAGGPSDRATLAGMDPARADIILAGALILCGLAEAFRVSEFTFSEYALREGVLMDAVRRLMPASDHEIRHVAIESALKLSRRCDEDPEHASTVSRLACRIFDQLAGHFALDVRDRLYLEAASLLANVGLTVSHSKHHLHSYYVIRNAELLGLSDREIDLVAQIARYHRKSEPKDQHPEFAKLAADDKSRVRVLAGILRVSIGLDRTHDARVEDVHVDVAPGGGITLGAVAPASVDLDLNIYAANERASLLEHALGYPLTVGVAVRD